MQKFPNLIMLFPLTIAFGTYLINCLTNFFYICWHFFLYSVIIIKCENKRVDARVVNGGGL
ncbi:MAG: hypothetical protein D6822_05360 [Cyanobacteria bacterium J149]|nr:MAG: hypothetical protein D6822_05360 [Cyanobacteria bacterium J149]